MENLAQGITTYAYFVNWKVVDECYQVYKDEFNLLDGLLGSSDPARELERLLRTYPRISLALPSLIAKRVETKKGLFNILTKFSGGELDYEKFEFSEAAAADAGQRARILEFARDSGILDLYTKGRIRRSTLDYVIGVEVGSDTNGRKNRGGRLMELVVEEIAKRICDERGWKWIPQATAARIKKAWGIEVPERDSDWRPDVAFLVNGKLWLVECNFYNSQGSKLKATAGEYETSAAWCKQKGIGYVWITDGNGWKSSEAQLGTAFRNIDYTLSLKMCSAGCLEDILAS